MSPSKCPSCGSPLLSPKDVCIGCSRGDDATREAFNETAEAFSETQETLIPVVEPSPRREPPNPVATGGAVADDVSVTIRARPEYAAVPQKDDPIVRLLVDVSAQGMPTYAAGPGPLAHVILLLDVSASMNQPDKYPVLTDALRGLIEELSAKGSPEVVLSIVVFGHGAKTLFRDVPASTLDAQSVISKIDASPYRFGRYTDFAGALKRAGRIAVEQLRANRAMPIRTYLLTDGRPQDLARTRRVMSRISKLPIDVDAFAFGEDADVGLLQELVSGGRGGTVKHVRDETLADAFGRIAESARRIVSNRATFEFALDRGVVGSTACRYRPGRHSFGDAAFADATQFRADLGTIETGRVYSLLFELRLPQAKEAVTKVGRITVRLRTSGAGSTTTADVAVPRTGLALPEADQDVVAATEVIAALSGNDAKTQLAALRVRRKLYAAERRDPHVRAIIDKAIGALETRGSLAVLTAAEYATLRSHTCTAGSLSSDVGAFRVRSGD